MSKKSVLRSHFPEEDLWVLQHNKELFDWLEANITEDNILTPEELAEYRAIPENERLSGDALEAELAAYNKEFEGIFDATDEDVEAMRKEIEFYKSINAKQEQLIVELKEAKSRVQLPDVAAKQQKLDAVVGEVREKLVQLEDLQKKNSEKVAVWADSLSSAASNVTFMHQLPIGQFHYRCDQFIHSLETYMKANFKMKQGDDESDTKCPDPIGLRQAKAMVTKSEMKLIEAEAELAGEQHLIDSLRELRGQPINPNEMIRITQQLNASNPIVAQQIQTVEQEIRELLEAIAEHDFNQSFVDLLQRKVDRIRAQLTALGEIKELCLETLTLAELLWVLFQLDMERLNMNSAVIVTSMMREAQNVRRRVQLMQEINQQQPPAVNLELILRNQNALKEEMAILMSRARHQDIDAVIRDLEATGERLLAFIFNGPLKKPQLTDVGLQVALHERGTRAANLKRVVDTVFANYNENRAKMEKNKFYRYRHLLWIWFLTEPKKVLMALEEIKAHAKSHGGVPGADDKKLMGILRKQE